MAKISLDSAVSGYNAATIFNSNNDLLEEALNSKVLYRDNPSGEANQMECTLDMNSNRQINLPYAISATEPTTFAQVLSMREGLEGTISSASVLKNGGTLDSYLESKVAADKDDLRSKLSTYNYSIGDIVYLLSVGENYIIESGTTDNDATLISDGVSGLQATMKYGGSLRLEWFGGGKNASASENDAAFISIIAFAKAARTGLDYRVTIDLGGSSINISEPIVINTSGLTIKNGTIIQTDNTKDGIQTDGSAGTIYYFYLDNVGIFISGTSSPTSGSNFRHLTGTLGWFKWTGLNSIMSQGYHGFSNGYGIAGTGGPIWELILDRLWFDNGWSSSCFIPSNGGVFSLILFDGGSTTYKLSNIHTSNIQDGSPAYRLGNGIDHAILENVTADHCTKFSEFKVKTLIIKNCGMEVIKAPPDAASSTAFYLAAEHNLVVIGQQQSCELTGFTSNFSTALQTTPHPSTNHIATDSANVTVTGVIGGTVSTGRIIRANGGNVVKTNCSVPGALSDIVINGGRINDQTNQRFISSSSANSTFNLFAQDTTKTHVYLISLIYEFGGLSSTNTFIVTTAGTSGGSKGKTTLLQGAIDSAGASMTVTGGYVQATVPVSTYVDWSAIDLTAL